MFNKSDFGWMVAHIYNTGQQVSVSVFQGAGLWKEAVLSTVMFWRIERASSLDSLW